jgi:manganese/zinc/iron transport system substrate-binding protein
MVKKKSLSPKMQLKRYWLRNNRMKTLHYFIGFIFALGSVVVFNGCATRPERDASHPLRVVATTGIIADAIQQIAQGAVDVHALMGPGVDPHLYKATQGDVKHLLHADVIFYNGLHLEGKMGEIFEKLARKRTVVAVTDHIPRNALRGVAGYDNTYDPHVWFDISLWKNVVTTIAETLMALDTPRALVYQQNLVRYQAQLDSLEGAVRHAIQQIPPQQRVLITAHDAFGYFGDAYDLEERALQGISTMSEFGVRDVTDLVDFIVTRKIKAIFVEASLSPRSIEAVLAGCRKRGWEVHIGGHLYTDALGDAGSGADTYIAMVHHNVSTLVESLRHPTH